MKEYDRDGKTYIPVEKLEEGYLYSIDARNASYGIWFASEQGFVIRRHKFGSVFLFTEIHWDLSESFGTVKPLLKLEKSPYTAEDAKHVEVGGFWCVPKNDEILEYLKNRTEFWGTEGD
jgi:hypothetical protein